MTGRQLPPSAGCPEHTYTQSVRQCAQCAQSVLMSHDTLQVCAYLFLEVYTWCTLFVEPKTHFANFFWAAGNFLHNFPGQDRTSCTLFEAVFRNLYVLALHPVHTLCPPTGCPVPPGAPSARPCMDKIVWIMFIYSGIRASGEAHGVRRQHARRQGQNDAAKYIRGQLPRGATRPLFRLALIRSPN